MFDFINIWPIILVRFPFAKFDAKTAG